MFDTTWYNKELWQRHSDSTLPPPPPDPEVEGAALLFWEEHCVECSIPECYSTCRLYVARRDQKCARFVYGIAPNEQVSGLLPYGADVSFRRWGKLEARLFGAPRLAPLAEVRRHDAWERRLEAVANATADVLQPVNGKRRVNGLHAFLRNRWLKRAATAAGADVDTPDAFYVKLFNPSDRTLALSIEFHQDRLVYRDQIPAEPGWNSMTIPLDQINLRPGMPGRILVSPANDEEARFLFTWLDFVRFAPAPAATQAATPASKVKCVVWDLDNTLWRGVIGDDGADGVQVNPDARALIEQLDQRGIVQSIASKNTYEVAWGKIESLGLQDYFLYPAIHWGPKSRSVQQIADELNINVDTFAVIDDSAFERAEIGARLPQVRLFDAPEIADLLSRPEFNVPVTEASRMRRLSYLAEAQRKRIAASYDDLDGFLRSCEMHLRIDVPSVAQRDRCLELIARTNQLNLSTRRFTEAELDALLTESGTDCYALSCRDRFGDYGLVGFASIEKRGDGPTLRDFVLSCRVAEKRVEEAFVFWYARKARASGADRLRAVLIATDRNQPLRDTLRTLPFNVVEQHERTTVLEMPLSDSLPQPDLITIETGD